MDNIKLKYEDIQLLLYLLADKWTARENGYKDRVIARCKEYNLEAIFDPNNVLKIKNKDYQIIMRFVAKADIYIVNCRFRVAGKVYGIAEVLNDYISPKENRCIDRTTQMDVGQQSIKTILQIELDDLEESIKDWEHKWEVHKQRWTNFSEKLAEVKRLADALDAAVDSSMDDIEMSANRLAYLYEKQGAKKVQLSKL